MPRKPVIALALVTVAAAAASPRWASAATPPPVPVPLPMPLVPNTAQQRVQAQLTVQQAQAQARLAASQAQVQAMLDASQARLEGQVAAQEQAQQNAARRGATPITRWAESPLPTPWPMQEPAAASIGTMRLTTLTPQLGRYFGASQGVLVVRAPAHGVLKLQDGDVILSIGGRVPASSSQAVRILTSYDPGEKIRLVILREHRRIHLTTSLPPLSRAP